MGIAGGCRGAMGIAGRRGARPRLCLPVPKTVILSDRELFMHSFRPLRGDPSWCQRSGAKQLQISETGPEDFVR